MWSVWDKISPINGFSAQDFLEKNKHLQNDETIFIKTVNGRTTQVESKAILASAYDVDENLDNDAFIAEYERIINMPTEEVLIEE